MLDINGARYECVVDNISTIGAFIELKAPSKNRIHVGDRGVLHVLLLTPVKYLCRAVRIEAKGIGLQFIGN